MYLQLAVGIPLDIKRLSKVMVKGSFGESYKKSY